MILVVRPKAELNASNLGGWTASIGCLRFDSFAISQFMEPLRKFLAIKEACQF